jgi:hypothetical protein
MDSVRFQNAKIHISEKGRGQHAQCAKCGRSNSVKFHFFRCVFQVKSQNVSNDRFRTKKPVSQEGITGPNAKSDALVRRVSTFHLLQTHEFNDFFFQKYPSLASKILKSENGALKPSQQSTFKF